MNFEQLSKNFESFFSSSKVLNYLPDMVLIIDFEGVIKEANSKAAEHFGIIENITINELFNDAMKAVRQSVKLKKSILVLTKNTDRYLELTASKVDSDYYVCIRDNTKVINENAEKNGIEKFNNEKNAMLVKLENDIKSPITSISGFSQGLIDGIGGEITEKQAKYLKIINSNANELDEFVSKLLDFSNAESLLYAPDCKKFDIVNEIKEFLKDFDKTIDSEKIKISLIYDGLESRNVYNDYKAFKKSFTNIMEVSLNSTEIGNIQIILCNPDEESFITYGLDENKKYIQIIIKDLGASIPKEELLHICNPYKQLDKGHKNILKSFRLGIASILAKRAKGFFNLSSENGNLYSIIIPVEKEENE